MPAHRAARRTRRTCAAALGSLSLLAVLGPGAGAALAAGPDLYKCDDFQYQEDAQEVYDADPSDPHDLDREGDGVACESRPHRPAHTELGLDGDTSSEAASSGSSGSSGSSAPSTRSAGSTVHAASSAPSRDRDCEDFSSQAEAQDALDADPSDPERLDADDDGVACESFTYGDEVDTAPAAASSGHSSGETTPHHEEPAGYPVGGVEAGDGSAPADSTPFLLASGLLGATAVGAAATVRHGRPGGRHRRA